jgi:cystathionine gamma-lyase
MSENATSRAAALSHLRSRDFAKGDPIPLPLTMASIFHTPGAEAGFDQYGRYDNPTWRAVEHALGHLEDAQCVTFPSGFFALLKSGDRVLLPSDGYHATRAMAERFLKPLGIVCDTRPTPTFLDGGFGGYRLVFAETPSNPRLDICDIPAVAEAVHKQDGLLVIDNTTMTPFGQRPLDHGADIVVSADTKAVNGHSDVLFGHVASRDPQIISKVTDWRSLVGGIPGPFEAWLVHRGLETLEVRFDRMCSSAEAIARKLKGHRAVSGLRYPGLDGDPSHNLARAQMERFGFLISFELASERKAEDFIDNCALIESATSFGGVHTSAERRSKRGDAVPAGFVRLSIGCEPVEELWQAIEASLDRIAS